MSKWNEGYAAGHKAAWERRDATDHLIRYAAIRRAVELARRVDCQCGCHGDLDANAMRRAIRAAIGSPKA